MLILDHGAAVRKVAGMATFPGSTWRPGPRSKQGYPGLAINAAQGVICHSAVGSLAGAMARLDNIARNPDGTFTERAAASWHFTIAKDGRVLQHYDTLAVCWHAGSRGWNGRLIGIEHEGGADTPATVSEPLTPEQLAASVNLVRWLSVTHNFPLVRFDGTIGGSLFEHRQVYATACPSGRIPWAEYEEEPMTDAERARYDGAITNILKKLGEVGASAEANTRLLEVLIPPLVSGTPAERFARFIWIAAGKAWTA